MKNYIRAACVILGMITLYSCPLSVFANDKACSLVYQREQQEEQIPVNYIGISFYQPNYVFPLYYTGSPDNRVYQNHTPYNDRIKNTEAKFQFSFKVPVWKKITDYTSLYFAYTQLSYWQIYNHNPFIRENDYEPELFLANKIDGIKLFGDLCVNNIKVGLIHQSNGFGNSLQRGWDRLYAEAIASNNNWMLSFQPWVIVAKNANNSNIGTYMGYSRFIVAYKYQQQVIALRTYNVIESLGRRPSASLTWSFPLTVYLKGYAEVFSGYGQSIIEYNHHTNSAGIGIALSDWV